LNDSNSEVLGKYGEALLFEGKDLPKAAEILKKALNADPNSDNIISALGYVMEKLSRPDEAILYYEMAIEKKTTRDSIYYRLA
jgi:tetratricopeptide (TPR) repeat protein